MDATTNASPAEPNGGADPAASRPWRAAGKRFRLFLRQVPARGRVVILAGSQPDGLVAGALLWQALRRDGRAADLIAPPPAAPLGSPELGQRLAALAPSALLVVGLGDPPTALAPGRPTLAIDHLPLGAEASDRLAISGADWRPRPSTSIIAFWLGQSIADLRRHEWLAAVGALAALGEHTDHPMVVAAKRAYGGAWSREVVILLRAVERCANPPVAAAVGLLLAARDPKEIVTSERPERGALAAARAEVEAAIDGVRSVEPAALEPFTLVQVDSPCAVQGVLAGIWANRRPKRPVLIGNRGRRPGWVAFAALAPPGDDWLNRPPVPPPTTIIDRQEGEDRAVNGQVPAPEWPAFLDRLGLAVGSGPTTQTRSERGLR